jgi:MFS family permease
MQTELPGHQGTDRPKSMMSIVLASSAGTVIEWYDFYLYGSLAVLFAHLFYPGGDPFIALLVSIATFSTGFVVRPVGALVFGAIGDRIGRKRTFLTTLTIMGASTTLVGLLPTYHQAGYLAAVLLVLLRLVQGLAIGGEYGGAAVYIAEHAPSNRRGFYTSFIQTTATLGFVAALAVIFAFRSALGTSEFDAWGWRLPFLLSSVLLVLTLKVRLKMAESPVFEDLKQTGSRSASPIRDSFMNRAGLATFAKLLFGVTAGLGVVWYTAQFYALYFLQTILKLDFTIATTCIVIAMAIATPLFVFFGALSDRIGRRWLILMGMVLAACAYYPVFNGMKTAAELHDYVRLTALLVLQLVFVAMVYGPNAAYLVERIPAKVRYTSLSFPYHIGTGVIGGFVPLVGLTLVHTTGNIYAGLIYPAAIALVCVVVNVACLRREHIGATSASPVGPNSAAEMAG